MVTIQNLFYVRNHQHRAGGVPDHVLSHASQKNPRESCSSKRPHDDEVDISILGFLNNRFVHPTAHANNGFTGNIGLIDLLFSRIQMLPHLG